MEVDNFKLIGQYLDWPDEDVFYFGQILQRRKDQPDKESFGPDNKVLKDLYFESAQKFKDKEEEIKNFCKYFNARAYIHLNKRSKKDVGFELLKIVADGMAKGEFQSLRSAYSTACGQRMSDDQKTWIVDVDTKDRDIVIDFRLLIDSIFPQSDFTRVLMEVPTPNGSHLICRPFNSKLFLDRLNEIEHDLSENELENVIQKNNPTVLYCNLK